MLQSIELILKGFFFLAWKKSATADNFYGGIA